MPTILVTGAAGFIGFHLSQRLLARGDAVIGVDNLNNYYDVSLKRARLAQLQAHSAFRFYQEDLANRSGLARIFAASRPERVVNLAAQAGVRYSLENPAVFVDSNIVGFLHLLESCREGAVAHLVFASSSSVYGISTKTPFSVRDCVDHPISLYAATKKANELMAHTYSYLYGLPVTGLRFFSVYGPWGRPDMALFLFTKAILEGRPIDVFAHGNMQRDFTYIDDVVESVVRVLEMPPQPLPTVAEAPAQPEQTPAPYRLYNVGNSRPVSLLRLIEVLEECLGRKADKNFLTAQPGEVMVTFAEVEDLIRHTGFRPSTPLEEGVAQFVKWYHAYYQIGAPTTR